MGDWSYYSDKWTPELKKQLKVRDSDKKYYFFITLQSYWDYFWQTSICAEHNESIYSHSQRLHNFNDEGHGEYQVFYQFNLKREINFREDTFAISLFQ